MKKYGKTPSPANIIPKYCVVSIILPTKIGRIPPKSMTTTIEITYFLIEVNVRRFLAEIRNRNMIQVIIASVHIIPFPIEKKLRVFIPAWKEN